MFDLQPIELPELPEAPDPFAYIAQHKTTTAAVIAVGLAAVIAIDRTNAAAKAKRLLIASTKAPKGRKLSPMQILSMIAIAHLGWTLIRGAKYAGGILANGNDLPPHTIGDAGQIPYHFEAWPGADGPEIKLRLKGAELSTLAHGIWPGEERWAPIVLRAFWATAPARIQITSYDHPDHTEEIASLMRRHGHTVSVKQW